MCPRLVFMEAGQLSNSGPADAYSPLITSLCKLYLCTNTGNSLESHRPHVVRILSPENLWRISRVCSPHTWPLHHPTSFTRAELSVWQAAITPLPVFAANLHPRMWRWSGASSQPDTTRAMEQRDQLDRISPPHPICEGIPDG